MAETYVILRVGPGTGDIRMSDGTKPDDLPPADERAGLPTPPSPGRLPPPHLPPPPGERDPSSDASGTDDKE
jgi:hypothetical protein